MVKQDPRTDVTVPGPKPLTHLRLGFQLVSLIVHQSHSALLVAWEACLHTLPSPCIWGLKSWLWGSTTPSHHTSSAGGGSGAGPLLLLGEGQWPVGFLTRAALP